MLLGKAATCKGISIDFGWDGRGAGMGEGDQRDTSYGFGGRGGLPHAQIHGFWGGG